MIIEGGGKFYQLNQKMKTLLKNRKRLVSVQKKVRQKPRH